VAEADPTTAVAHSIPETFKKVRQLVKLNTSLISALSSIPDLPNYACEKGVEKDWLYNKYIICGASPSDKKGIHRKFSSLLWTEVKVLLAKN
jgi:hypothetical protein